MSGSGHPQPFALVLPAEEIRPKLQTGSERQRFEGELRGLLSHVNKKVEPYERLQFLAVVKDPWLIENGFLTPTMKIKRSALEDTYGPRVEQWYGAGQPVVWEG